MNVLDPESLHVKLYADGADIKSVEKLVQNPFIKGFTTNPTLMRQAKIADYVAFARHMLDVVAGRPVSFEVFADDFPTMRRQAETIAGWGPNVYVKIPVTNTKGEFCGPLVRKLAADGVQVNVTAIMTHSQIEQIAQALSPLTAAVVSVFAGRIADTGRDPVPYMAQAVKLLASLPKVELLWASPRELLNVLHAEQAGCDIITVSHGILDKIPLLGKDLKEYSLETVSMFYQDAAAAGYEIH